MTIKEPKGIRSFLFPVHRGEYRKFIPMFLMSFLICFNYYILRITKTSLVVTAPESGAEALPFIKVWAVLPMALLMTFAFTRLSNFLSRRNVFYALMWFYILYFALFIFVLYPYRDTLHPHQIADSLQASLPAGFKGFIAMFRNWTYTSFYVMSEMWSTMIMTILFWGFANDVTSVKEAKRFYGLFCIGTNISGIAAGYIVSSLSIRAFDSSLASLGFGNTAWDQSFTFLILIVIAVSLFSIVLYWWQNSQGLGYTQETEIAHKEAPIKMGMRKNFAYLAKSPYLTLIAILVVTFNIVLNLTEIVWEDQLRKLYPNASDFNTYTARVVFWLSIIAAVISLFISGNLIRRFGWTVSALISPIVTLIAGVFFFACLLGPKETISHISLIFGATPLVLGVFLGSLQHCLLRGTKYSLVDSTKELAFVPLDQESKLKGKAAIDGVGSRLGKSGGSVLYQGLIMIFGSVTGSVPIVGALLLIALIGWIFCVRALGKQFTKLTSDQKTAPQEGTLEASQEATLSRNIST